MDSEGSGASGGFLVCRGGLIEARLVVLRRVDLGSAMFRLKVMPKSSLAEDIWCSLKSKIIS
jgi:hypothetical protein